MLTPSDFTAGETAYHINTHRTIDRDAIQPATVVKVTEKTVHVEYKSGRSGRFTKANMQNLFTNWESAKQALIRHGEAEIEDMQDRISKREYQIGAFQNETEEGNNYDDIL